jgi:hypothetical protein
VFSTAPIPLRIEVSMTMTVSADIVLDSENRTTPVSGADLDGSSGTALQGQAAVLIWNDIASEGRDQFYRWHDNEHMPERLALPGFRRGRRFSKPGHSPEWLTMYEAVDVSALISPEYLARLNAPTAATAAALKHFRNTSRAVCRVVRSVGSSMGGHMLAIRLNVPQEQLGAMSRYLCDDAFPRAIASTGIVACHLYQADRSASYVNTAESSTRQFDVPAWVILCEASTAAAATKVHDTFDRNEFTRLGVEVRKDAAVYALEICRLSSALYC